MMLTTMKGERVKIVESIAPNWRTFGLLMDLDSSGQKLGTLKQSTHANGMGKSFVACSCSHIG